MRERRGITLIALVITVIILIILAVVGINWALGEGGLIDRSKQARFYQKISTLEEDAKIRAYDTYFEKKTLEELIPNYGEVTQEQKNTILKEVPTLNETVFRITGETVYDRDLYWLNKEEILKDDKQYVIDMDTLQVYDYEGEKFLSVNNPKNQGVYIGTALQDGSVILKADVSLGDGISFGDNGFILTKILNGKDKISEAKSGMKVKLFPNKFSKGDRLFKTNDQKFEKELRKSFENEYVIKNYLK